jgi:uncharacterized membrane protein YbhN (UPF0104 family)
VGAKGPPTARQWLVRVAKIVVFVALLAALAFSVRSQWGSVRHELASLPIAAGITAVVLALLATAVSMLAWRTILADLGSRLALPPSVHIYALSQLGKYLPGSVWPVLGQMELGRAFDVPRLRSATAFLLVLLGSVVSATAAGGLLAFTSPGWGRAFALLPLVVLVMHPRVLVPLTSLLGRVLRRPAVTQPPSLGGIARALGWLSLQWLSLGISTAVMAHGLAAHVSLTRCIAAVSLAWAAGLVVVFVPAGVGVREGVFTYLLAPAVGSSRALALALLGRFALTIADAIGAAVGAFLSRRSPKGVAAALPLDTPG